MDIMLKTTSLLLLTLILDWQLSSSAPIPSGNLQLSAFGKDPGQHTQVPDGRGPVKRKKESARAKVIPVVAVKAAPQPEEPPTPEDIPVISKEPEPEDQVSNDPEETVSQESAPQELLVDPLKEETIPEEANIAEESQDEVSEQQDVEDLSPEDQVPVVVLEASEQEAAGDKMEEETPAVESAGENPLTELLLTVIDDKTEAEEKTLPGTEEEPVVLVTEELVTRDGDQEEPAAEETVPEDPVFFIPLNPDEEEPELEEEILTEAEEDPFPGTEEEEPAVLVTKELDKEEVHQEEPDLEETVPEDHVIIPLDSVEEEPELEEAIHAAVEEGEPDESVIEEPAVIVPVGVAEKDEKEEPKELVEIVSVDLEETDEEEEPEDPAVIVPVDEEETDEEEELEDPPVIVPVDDEETDEEKEPEEEAEVEEAAAVVLEENAKEDPDTNEEPLPSTLDEEEVILPEELEDEDQVELITEDTEPQESELEDSNVTEPLVPDEEEPDLVEETEEESISVILPDEPDEEVPEDYSEEDTAVVPHLVVLEENTEEEALPSEPDEDTVVLGPADFDTADDGEEEERESEKYDEVILGEPTDEEPAQEDPDLIIPLEEEAPEDEVAQSDPFLEEEEEDTAPQETEKDDSNSAVLVMSVTETLFVNETVEPVLEPLEAESADVTEVLGETFNVTESSLEMAVTDAQQGIVPSTLDGGNGTRIDLMAAAISTEEEPVALVNRGTVLGAAFFTLMSFIIFGFVWTTVSKKLR